VVALPMSLVDPDASASQPSTALLGGHPPRPSNRVSNRVHGGELCMHIAAFPT
jgi:hypothetical protein